MNRELFLALESGPVPTTFVDFRRQFSHLISDVTFHGDTPLHIAARRGHLQLVEWILAEKPSLNRARNKDGNTPLHEAAKSGRPDLIEILLHRRESSFKFSDLVDKFILHSSYKYNKLGETALVIASQYGHEEVADHLLHATSADLFEWHRSVKEAAYRGYIGVVAVLLNSKPSRYPIFLRFVETIRPNRRMENRISYYSTFIRPFILGFNEDVSILKFLTSVIPKIPILHLAVEGGYLEIVVAMLNHRSWRNNSMTETDGYGRCAIHVAAMKGYWEIVNEFMSRMPDSVDIRSSDNKSVLHFAVEHNQLNVVTGLLANREVEKAVKMVSRDYDHSGNTSLHWAAMDGANPQVHHPSFVP